MGQSLHRICSATDQIIDLLCLIDRSLAYFADLKGTFPAKKNQNTVHISPLISGAIFPSRLLCVAKFWSFKLCK